MNNCIFWVIYSYFRSTDQDEIIVTECPTRYNYLLTDLVPQFTLGHFLYLAVIYLTGPGLLCLLTNKYLFLGALVFKMRRKICYFHGFQCSARCRDLSATAAWHGHTEGHRPPLEVSQEHPEDHPVHEDGLRCQVHQGRKGP